MRSSEGGDAPGGPTGGPAAAPPLLPAPGLHPAGLSVSPSFSITPHASPSLCSLTSRSSPGPPGYLSRAGRGRGTRTGDSEGSDGLRGARRPMPRQAPPTRGARSQSRAATPRPSCSTPAYVRPPRWVQPIDSEIG